MTVVKSKKKNVILKVAFVLFAVYIAVTLINLQVEMTRKNQELTAIKAEQKEQQLKNEDIERLLEEDNDSEYIERVARDKLGYAKPNERIFVNGSGK